MSNFIDITGKKYNKLTAIDRVENSKNGKTRWLCLCECGNKTIVSGSNLKNGLVKSCGCLSHEHSWNRYVEDNSKRLYSVWCGIKGRCKNKNNPSYKNYGGRGITICEEWENFLTFESWSYKNGYKENMTIERNDVNGNYCPENCCWIPKNKQASNRRTCYKIEYNGQIVNLSDLCEKLGLNYKRVHNRIHKLGWSVEKAISTETYVKRRNKEALKKYGIN